MRISSSFLTYQFNVDTPIHNLTTNKHRYNYKKLKWYEYSCSHWYFHAVAHDVFLHRKVNCNNNNRSVNNTVYPTKKEDVIETTRYKLFAQKRVLSTFSYQ